MCGTVLNKIPTDCEAIDKILEGGLPVASVSLVYGEAETGKTTLAMQCAVNCARKGYKTLFADCDGTFSARRLPQIAIRDFKDVAERIALMKPDNFGEQVIIINQLTDYITKSFGLVVIDTMTSLYRTEIAEHPEKTFELNREINRQMACLAQIAITQKIAVLITSQVQNVFNKTYVSIEPLATRVLRFWAETIIAMKPTENPQIVKAILEKGSKTMPPLTCQLKIEETGIHEHSIG